MALASIHCELYSDGWNWHFLSDNGRILWSGEGRYPTVTEAIKAGRRQRVKFQQNQAEVDHCRK